MLKLLPKPAVIAHRGASAHAPENTLASFQLAVDQKADAIELDVRLSKDGQIVVFHDREVDRTTDCQGNLKNFSLNELKTMDAGSYFDQKFNEERIPTLLEILSIFEESALLNIEIKTQFFHQTGLAVKVARMIHNRNIIDRTLISSFNPLDLISVRRFSPDIDTGILVPPGKNGYWAELIGGKLVKYDSIHFYFRDITQELIKKYHKKNKFVFAFTVNNNKEILNLIDMGIDGIFTDNPLLAKQLLYTR